MKHLCKACVGLFVFLSFAYTSNLVAGEWDWVSKEINARTDHASKRLSDQERTILLATIALKSDKPNAAIALLLQAKQAKDPLVDLLEAEAYRQQAIQAMRESGAGDMDQQERMLQSADLNNGLGEAEARLNAFVSNLRSSSGEPVDVLLAGDDMANVFMFDKALNRLFVFQPTASGQLKKITDEYVVTGSIQGDKKREGDGKTPHGIYHFIKKLQGKQLESRYGPVAFPIDYPNELDALHKKNGSGIWLHGYPMDVSRRPPQDTRGCFSLNNTRLVSMAKHVRLHRSWVIVGENFIFDNNEQKQQLLTSVQRDIEAWRKDWISLDSKAYLSHYHAQFRSGKRDLAAWKRYKTRVNSGKRFIDVNFTSMTLIHDPNTWPEGDVVVAEFEQHYRSSNYADEGRKRLYLARANANQAWQILLEESLPQ
ncbi:MAG: L,D-transpeptidase family protein [Mariprofundus sp.]|nr:L,D-transpeptidase family protein [Mariprofundus sp.]